MAMIRNPKTRSVLGFALYFTIATPVLTIAVEALLGENFKQLFQERILQLENLLLILAVYFPIGILVGLLNWHYLNKQNSGNNL